MEKWAEDIKSGFYLTAGHERIVVIMELRIEILLTRH